MNIPILVENWPTFLADMIGLIRSELFYLKLRNTLKIEMRPHSTDSSNFVEIWIMRYYSPTGLEIGETDTVVDIGAHIGLFSLMAASQARKGVVYALEPNGENFRMLQNNTRINGIKNLVPINVAVANEDGERELYVSPGNPASHSFYSTERNKKELVRTVCLESFLDERNIRQVDYLKMDCEGAEYEILCNCPSRVLKVVKKIALEYHIAEERATREKLACLKARLLEHGFVVDVNPLYNDLGMLYANRVVEDREKGVWAECQSVLIEPAR